jgi:hypothetical protein
LSQSGKEPFDRKQAILDACTRLAIRDRSKEPLVFDAWDDLCRGGMLSYGFNLSNPDPPWTRLTGRGISAVANLCRDPANPAGYREAIGPYVKDRNIAESYLAEALDTFNRGCVKAAAVMLGCAAESLNLDLRDRLRTKLAERGTVPPVLTTGGLPPFFDRWRTSLGCGRRTCRVSFANASRPTGRRGPASSAWRATRPGTQRASSR